MSEEKSVSNRRMTAFENLDTMGRDRGPGEPDKSGQNPKDEGKTTESRTRPSCSIEDSLDGHRP